jgi:hypothetical protein
MTFMRDALSQNILEQTNLKVYGSMKKKSLNRIAKIGLGDWEHEN